MGCSLVEALDFEWNNNVNDLSYLLKYQQRSPLEKLSNLVSDHVVYLFARLLGIDSFNSIFLKRTSVEIRNEYDYFVLNKSNISPHNQKIILVLNGNEHIPVSPSGFQILEKQSGYLIVFRLAADEDVPTIITDLKKSGNQIEALWARAHGTPHSMKFNRYGRGMNVSPQEADCFADEALKRAVAFREALNQIEPDAPIILESCYTGQTLPAGEENFAQFISRGVQGRKVYAPSREALVIDKTVTFSKEEGFKVGIKGSAHSRFFSKGTLLGRMEAIWYAYKNKQEDITVTFQYNAKEV